MPAILPTDIFPNLSSDGTNITIPLSDFTGLTDTEADPSTGDGRKVAYEMVKKIADSYIALDTASRPEQMSAAIGVVQGQSATEARRTYTLSFDLDIAGSDLADES